MGGVIKTQYIKAVCARRTQTAPVAGRLGNRSHGGVTIDPHRHSQGLRRMRKPPGPLDLHAKPKRHSNDRDPTTHGAETNSQ